MTYERLTELRQRLLWIANQEALLQSARDSIMAEYTPLLLALATETGQATPQPGAVVATKVTPQIDVKVALPELMKNPDANIGYLAIRPDAMNVFMTLAIQNPIFKNAFQVNDKAMKDAVLARYNELIKNGISEPDALDQCRTEFVGLTGFKVDQVTSFKPTSATDVTPVKPEGVAGELTSDTLPSF